MIYLNTYVCTGFDVKTNPVFKIVRNFLYKLKNFCLSKCVTQICQTMSEHVTWCSDNVWLPDIIQWSIQINSYIYKNIFQYNCIYVDHGIIREFTALCTIQCVWPFCELHFDYHERYVLYELELHKIHFIIGSNV